MCQDGPDGRTRLFGAVRNNSCRAAIETNWGCWGQIRWDLEGPGPQDLVIYPDPCRGNPLGRSSWTATSQLRLRWHMGPQTPSMRRCGGDPFAVGAEILAILLNFDVSSSKANFSIPSHNVIWSKQNGGWSAIGQPCDAFYVMFPKLANSCIDRALGRVAISIAIYIYTSRTQMTLVLGVWPSKIGVSGTLV